MWLWAKGGESGNGKRQPGREQDEGQEVKTKDNQQRLLIKGFIEPVHARVHVCDYALYEYMNKHY